jgi:hypothetical protein
MKGTQTAGRHTRRRRRSEDKNGWEMQQTRLADGVAIQATGPRLDVMAGVALR